MLCAHRAAVKPFRLKAQRATFLVAVSAVASRGGRRAWFVTGNDFDRGLLGIEARDPHMNLARREELRQRAGFGRARTLIETDVSLK